ncbi:hypothetical protein RNAN_0040 [Rheinheimera nanhaiensis E407-8]|uniref:Uncharacterized protein n=1 Tax=Rheinheimera nanhaiensis E407-8 TaxID=562729 RepID=I1DSP9_9GAMM|nr:hypothetical protein RNAN_0040 [Rheinheimera nanhaiensis E407-8]
MLKPAVMLAFYLYSFSPTLSVPYMTLIARSSELFLITASFEE